VLTLLFDDLFENALARRSLAKIPGKKHDASRILPPRRKRNFEIALHDLLEECVRQRGEDAGTVSGVLLAPNRTAVCHIYEDRFGVFHYRVAGPAFDVSNETDAA
jgi:hypothetical protein